MYRGTGQRYSKEYYAQNKEKLAANTRKFIEKKRLILHGAKNVPCVDCGVRYPPHVMDFDHVRGKKEFQIGRSASVSDKKLLAEIAKCDVVCANCHRERTHQRSSST